MVGSYIEPACHKSVTGLIVSLSVNSELAGRPYYYSAPQRPQTSEAFESSYWPGTTYMFVVIDAWTRIGFAYCFNGAQTDCILSG